MLPHPVLLLRDYKIFCCGFVDLWIFIIIYVFKIHIFKKTLLYAMFDL